ncbi:hypothetical protein GCM10009682_24660 [Luedemannella flava]|uniref:DUF58 domain-containing protein n=1 Tax=Luedemannella flava TaxID=349316 RepID=A0ABP4Y2N0_9ACTN
MRVSVRGWGLLVVAAALLAVGFRYGYPELAALGGAGVAAVLAAVAFVAWRPRLTVQRLAEPDRVTRGETSAVRLRIGNASRLFGASVVARDRVGTPGGRRGTIPVPLVRLRPGRTTDVSYEAPTDRRGVVGTGPLEITRRDPLGLVGVVRRYGSTVRIWVRPRVHLIAAVPVGLSRSMDGRVDRVPHGSITFAALREYVVGDDLRQVHWRTSARVGELMVREHVDTSLPRIVVLLDDRAAAHTRDATGESTFEAACEAAASILVAAVQADVHAELVLVGGATVAGASASGLAALGPMLDLLAEATLTGDARTRDDEPLRAIVQGLRLRRLGDTLIVLTGPPVEEEMGAIAALKGAYPSIIVGVFGQVESGLGAVAGLLVVGATDGADFAAAWDGVRAW